MKTLSTLVAAYLGLADLLGPIWAALSLAGAALLRAMVPLTEPPEFDLAGKAVLLLAGASDPIVPADNTARLAALLKAGGAAVRQHTLPAGHGLSQADVSIARDWLAALTPR